MILMAYRHGLPDAEFRLDPWAEYAVLSADGGRMALEFRRVPFAVADLVAAYRSSGRPHAEDTVQHFFISIEPPFIRVLRGGEFRVVTSQATL